ncbi:MAG: DNA polymerase III subunit delta [Bacteroidota bacterium]
MPTTFSSILNDLKKKQYQPVYFLHGNEAYFIDAISDYIEKNVLSDGEKSFNQTILYGKEVDFKQVVDTARRYPMMAPYQVVILKEAQEMRTLKELAAYVEKPAATTILVICHKHKRFDGRSKFGKLLKKQAVFFEAKKLYDNQLPDWIYNYLQEKGLTIKPAAMALVAEYLGTDLSKVVNELDKLAINLPKGTNITAQHIQNNIGISKDYNVFELQKALGQKQVTKVNRIVKYFGANPRKNPMVMLVGSLYNYFSKIYMLHSLKNLGDQDIQKALKLSSSFFLREYRNSARNYPRPKTEKVLSILKEYDLKSKGVDNNTMNNPDSELMKEMVWRILHV